MHDLAIEYPEQFKKLRKTDNIASGFIRFFYLGFVIVLLAITFIPETWPNAPKIAAAVGLLFVAGYFTSILSSRNFVKNYEESYENFKKDLESKTLQSAVEAISEKYDTSSLNMNLSDVMPIYRYKSKYMSVSGIGIPVKDKDSMVQNALFVITKNGEISVDSLFNVPLKNENQDESTNKESLESSNFKEDVSK